VVAAREQRGRRVATRIVAVRHTTARALLLGLVVLMIAAALLAGPPVALGDQDHVAVVAAMRDGSDYYSLISGIVPAGAFAGRLVPLPTLALIESRIGVLGMTILLCAVLASLLLIGWNRIGERLSDWPARVVGALLLLGGAAAGALLTIVEPQTGWVALLAGWSLLLRQRGRWVEAAAIAAAAATIDPAALVLAIVMAAAALRDGEAHEGAGWAAAATLGLVTWLAHRVALSGMSVAAIGIGPAASPIDVAVAALLPGVPAPLGAAIWLVAIVGWTIARGDLAVRLAAVSIAGTAIALVPGMQSAATLTIVLLPLGLMFAVDAVASLARHATSRRRITVTRVAR
jgi:hypothetical protein